MRGIRAINLGSIGLSIDSILGMSSRLVRGGLGVSLTIANASLGRRDGAKEKRRGVTSQLVRGKPWQRMRRMKMIGAMSAEARSPHSSPWAWLYLVVGEFRGRLELMKNRM